MPPVNLTGRYVGIRSNKKAPTMIRHCLMLICLGCAFSLGADAQQTDAAVDYFTQSFSEETADITSESGEYFSVVFVPDTSTSGYSASAGSSNQLGTSPFCGERLMMMEDDSIEYSLQTGNSVTFFGEQYSTFFVGSNGYVTFGQGDTTRGATLEAHFSLPRISASFNPMDLRFGGMVSVVELTDRVAVSYYEVPDYLLNGAPRTCQVEMFFDGTIRITGNTFRYTPSNRTIVGLSRGQGLPEDFVESDFNAYPAPNGLSYAYVACEGAMPNDSCADAIEVVVGESYSGTTFGARGSSDASGCMSCDVPDVWYQFTPRNGGQFQLSLEGSRYGTYIAVYASSCDNLELVATDQGFFSRDPLFSGYETYSGISLDLTRLSDVRTYLIRVSGVEGSRHGQTGDFQLEVSGGEKSSGAACSGPQPGANVTVEALFCASIILILIGQVCRGKSEKPTGA